MGFPVDLPILAMAVGTLALMALVQVLASD
jgi:hypothetical protein